VQVPSTGTGSVLEGSFQKKVAYDSTGFLYGLFAAGVLSLPGVVVAQGEEAFHHFTLSAGAGLTTITGTDAGKLDHGGNLQLNGGYFFNRYFGITGNFVFSDLGITRAELNNLNQPDGAARVYGVTADPTNRTTAPWARV
jgi:hypothetical protein